MSSALATAASGVDAVPATLPALSPSAVEQLLAFRDAEVKFDMRDLMEVLRDRRHEGWVLGAYPDPKTRRPLIGAGFSLDLPAREHLQRDPLNPHLFLEPSSSELWQAAGLKSERLQIILEQYRQQEGAWTRKNRRTRIHNLASQVTTEDATQLLRVASIQSILNARAYCRNFDQLSAHQQMALSQLVYQMGVNLEEFTQFLSLINGPRPMSVDIPAAPGLAEPLNVGQRSLDFNRNMDFNRSMDWTAVQQSLVQSQWARLYRTRAVSVIAMLDPRYGEDPRQAERRVGAFLRPAVLHRSRSRSSARPELASAGRHTRRGQRGKASFARRKRRV